MQAAIQTTTTIATIGILVTSLEDVASLRLFRNDGILSWEVLKLQGSWSLKGLGGKVAGMLFDYRRFRILIIARLMASIVLLLYQTNQVVFLLCSFFILISLVALSLRSIYGLDGAHQMYVVIFGALFLGGLAGQESLGRSCSVWFVALQAGLAYLIAGVTKFISPTWRTGQALIGVLGTNTYGHPRAHSFFSRHLGMALLSSWIVILFECSFCLVFIVDMRVCLWVLAAGLCFHVINALVMGMNGFLFAFVATYPCVAYCARHISL